MQSYIITIRGSDDRRGMIQNNPRGRSSAPSDFKEKLYLNGDAVVVRAGSIAACLAEGALKLFGKEYERFFKPNALVINDGDLGITKDDPSIHALGLGVK